MSRSPYRLACALAAAVVASQAAAQAPSPSPYAPPPSAPGGVSSSPPAAPFRPRFYLGMGYDLGGEMLVGLIMTDGSTKELKTNSGFFLNVGGDFLPLADGLLHTRATIGYKFDSIEASNASVKFHSIPVEVVEFLNFAPLRLGVGMNLALQPKVSASGLLSAEVTAENSFGLVIAAEYEVKMGGGAGLVIGPRYLVQKLKASNGATFDGNTFGFYMAWLP